MFRWLKKIFGPKHYVRRCPERLQIEATECGAVSLQMVLEYYGVIIPLEQMRDECHVSRDGSTAVSLLKTARKYGFEAKGFRTSCANDILKYRLPSIVFWNGNHFLVCLGKKGRKWILNDPTYGRCLATEKEMELYFSGIVLEIKPGPNMKKFGKRESFIRDMSYLLNFSWLALLALLVIGILLLPQAIIQPNMNRMIIDYFMQDGYYDWGGPILYFSLLMLALTFGLSFLQQHSALLLNIRMTVINSYQMLKKLFALPLPFFQARFSGDLMNRVECCESVASFFANQFVTNILNFISLFLFAILLIYYDSVLGSFVLISSAILMVLLLRFMSVRKAASTRSSIEHGRMFGRTVHGITMIETLKASGMENEYFCYWSDMYKRYMKVRLKLQRDIEGLQIAQGAISKFSVALLAGLGAYRILLGQMSGGTYISFQMIFGCFMVPIFSLINMIDIFQKVRADATRLVDILHYKLPQDARETEGSATLNGLEQAQTDSNGQAQVKTMPGNAAANNTGAAPLTRVPKEHLYSGDSGFACGHNGPDVARLSGKVSIHDLVFGYNRNFPPVIDHINLEITPGERIAIVGLSGSGKSTMAKLISGAYQPWSGEILFDGRPRDSYSLSELRYSFAMVDQSVSLFPGNIRDNIAMYDPSLPFESVRQAAEDALIHDTITARPNGYEYEINAVGSNFSGGEQQRLEIARALAVNPSILLLDEATAALDAATELKIDRNLRRRGITTIVIAHRLSTIRDADRIIVLDHGKIAECGTHQELMKLNGIYTRLVNL